MAPSTAGAKTADRSTAGAKSEQKAFQQLGPKIRLRQQLGPKVNKNITKNLRCFQLLTPNGQITKTSKNRQNDDSNHRTLLGGGIIRGGWAPFAKLGFGDRWVDVGSILVPFWRLFGGFLVAFW